MFTRIRWCTKLEVPNIPPLRPFQLRLRSNSPDIERFVILDLRFGPVGNLQHVPSLAAIEAVKKIPQVSTTLLVERSRSESKDQPMLGKDTSEQQATLNQVLQFVALSYGAKHLVLADKSIQHLSAPLHKARSAEHHVPPNALMHTGNLKSQSSVLCPIFDMECYVAYEVWFSPNVQ